MTRDEWTQAAKVLQDTFPHTPVAVATWYKLLRDLDGVEVLKAVIHLCQTAEAFPSVSALRKLAAPSQGNAADAWGEFIAAVSRVGYTGTPRWTDPVIARVVQQLGGWQHICKTMLADQEPTWRAQFRKAYEATAERVQRDEAFAALGTSPAVRALSSGERGLIA